jgi:DNA-binding transcriptional MerR regulator
VKNDLDIVEVARRSGVPASTLRFYEEKGLIASMPACSSAWR